MPKADALVERIEAFHHASRGEIVVRKAARGYSLFSARTGAPIARLRPTGEADKVQVLWWNGERWGASGPFGVTTMPLDEALDYIATEPAFWIHA
jgi:hypothetical protein